MSGSGPVGVGLIGAGMISDTYLGNLTAFPDVRVVMLGNRDVERARLQAEKHHIELWGAPADVLAHPDIEIVVNLTVPAVHAEVTSQALTAGKHVWSEKPLSIDRATGTKLLDQAGAAGLLLGIAPDTVLGQGVQTARRAIARGDIGTPLSAQTVMQYAGPDVFHPSPEFLFARGGGPLLDVGPYYWTALVHIFGPCLSVAAVGSKGQPTRLIKVGNRAGTVFPVEVPTHVSAIAQFAGGVSQSVFSFDSPLTRFGIVEITGTDGTLIVPDPNRFTGAVKITRAPSFAALTDEPRWEDVPVSGPLTGRGVGVLDMARAIRADTEPLASGRLGYHVLDSLIAVEEAIGSGQVVSVASTVDPVPLLAEDFDPFAATL
jgi:predicted dehydrogenase